MIEISIVDMKFAIFLSICRFLCITLNFSRQKAKKMITRDDLVLDWRPLYKTFKEIFHGKDRVYNLKVGYP